MSVYAALLRGINVGGRCKLPMAELRSIIEALGGQNVSSYIQSGNAVFRLASPPMRFGDDLARAIDDRFGFRPATFILSKSRLAKVLAQNPFAETVPDPSKFLIVFLSAAPKRTDLEIMSALVAPHERFAAVGDVLYLHCPQGVRQSRLAAKAGFADIQATARNLRTVRKLADMMGGVV